MILIGLLVFSKGNAQQIFYSQNLQNLYYSLPEIGRDAANNVLSLTDTVVICYDIVKGDTVHIAYNWDKNRVLEHIGYKFLPVNDTITTDNMIVRFIERELMTMLLTSNFDQMLVSYRENGLSILLNDNPITKEFLQNKQRLLNFLKTNQGILINFDGEKYEVSLFCIQEQKISFHFPADSELITGMNIKERDIRLAVQLKNHKAQPDTIVPLDYNYLQLLHDSIYVDKGSMFMIPQINNDIFFTKIDGTFSLVFDSILIVETFSNTLIVPANMSYTINISHRMYGLQVEKYTVNSRDFDDYFLYGYVRYFGIESLEKEKLTGTLILEERNACSIHLAYVSVSLDDLLNGGTMEMRLYSNIPQHNINTLFGK